jgi:hypothetical protein
MKFHADGRSFVECPNCNWKFYISFVCSNCKTPLCEEDTRQRDFFNQMNDIEFSDTVDLRFYMSSLK